MKQEIVKIKKIKKETPTHSTIFFDSHISFQPGQFVMIWLPGCDEKPFTISYQNGQRFGVTIESKGIFTKKIIEFQKKKIGIRGPFGNGFHIDSKYKNICVVAGGCGMAPLALLIEEILAKKKIKTDIILGARSKQHLLFSKRFKNLNYCTDDGSLGFHGFVTDFLENKIKTKKYDVVYTCGPEIMMYKVWQICERKKINCFASLERYMRCGFGVCGACVCGGERVCKDGPVFSSAQLRKLKDFGKKAILKSGKEVSLDEYYQWRTPKK